MEYELPTEILKACDIRGIVGVEMDADDAYYIGRAYGTMLIRRNFVLCVVGYDGRHSSPGYCRRLVEGLTDCGINTINLGLVPTPVVYFALSHFTADAGVIVTASHNPSEYNGFKFFTKEGPFDGPLIGQFTTLCRNGDFAGGRGAETNADINGEYIRYLLGFLRAGGQRELKIIWDPGNGAAAVLLERLTDKLPGEHKIICGKVDGDFPYHHPDPSLEKNMLMLRQTVLAEGADAGIAFDGDADRIGIIDGAGTHWLGDQLLVLFARDLLNRRPGATIMSEVKASSFLFQDIENHGGKPLMWKVGHTNQKQRMLKEKIELAGETSGHIFFAENQGYDDGLFAALMLLNILRSGGKSLVEIRAEFPLLYDSGEIRLSLNTEERERLILRIARQLTSAGRSFVDIDGIRTEIKGGFWMLRASNTLPHITIRCECDSPEALERGLSDIRNQLTDAGCTQELYSVS